MGIMGVIRLFVVFLIICANVAFYTMLPIASLGLLPMIIGCITLLTATLDDMNLN
jgi:hypothetical protein